MDANKAYEEKAWQLLHKNAASKTEQVLEAAPHKTATVQPPITKTIKVRRTRHTGHCWRSKDEHISDVLLWIPSHRGANFERPARTYLQLLCADIRCSPEDLPGAMNDKDGWRKRVREIYASSATGWWYIYSLRERERENEYHP